jgi:YQGE family putative transporter
MNPLRKELAPFYACPHSMRILILANMIYAFVFPIIDIFLGAFVLRSSHQLDRVIVYQLSVYVAAPPAFLLNGLLMGRVAAQHLCAAGMVLSGVAMVALMYMGAQTLCDTVVVGLGIGLSTGFFWANRGFLDASTTEDSNRNYYYGVEFFVVTLAGVLVPAVTGWLLASTSLYGWLGGRLQQAYLLVACGALLLTVLAACFLEQGHFARQTQTRFLYFSFPRLWWRFLGITVLKGLAQGYLITAPAMLVFQKVGQEGTLGLVQAIGGALSALMLYLVGRATAPRHRGRIFGVGLWLYFVGALLLTWHFDALGVLLFLACLLPAKPLLDVAYNATKLGVIDRMRMATGRSLYAFLFHHEIWLLAGRALGFGVFFLIMHRSSPDVALHVVLPLVTGFQLLTLPLLRLIDPGRS